MCVFISGTNVIVHLIHIVVVVVVADHVAPHRQFIHIVVVVVDHDAPHRACSSSLSSYILFLFLRSDPM